MSRSTYIYMVMGRADPIAAFTVKHELVSWLVRRAALDIYSELRIFRLVDNGRPGSRLTEIEVADLFNSGPGSGPETTPPKGQPQVSPESGGC